MKGLKMIDTIKNSVVTWTETEDYEGYGQRNEILRELRQDYATFDGDELEELPQVGDIIGECKIKRVKVLVEWEIAK